MRIFLKSSGVGIIAFMCVLSCTNDAYLASEFKILKEEVEVIENPFVISEEEAISAAFSYTESKVERQHTEGFLTEIISVSQRSSEQGSKMQTSIKLKNYNVRIEEFSTKEKEVQQEIPVYTINYIDENGNDAGFVVIVGDERISSKVLIFSENNNTNFNMEERNDSDFLEDLINGFLYKCINIEEFNNPSTSRGGTLVIENQPQYGSISYFLTPALNFATSGDPFDRYTPFRNNSRCMAGCTAVAMSEIMAWHDWPLHGKFQRYTLNSSNLEIVDVSYELDSLERSAMLSVNIHYCQNNYPDALEYIGNLLVETGYRLNSNYGHPDTKAYPVDVPNVFEEMGYTSDTLIQFSCLAIENDIKNKILPVYMAGWKQNPPQDGHSYVIYGVMYKTINNIVEKYLKLIEGNTTSGVYYNPVTGYGYVWFNEKMFSTDYVDTGYIVPSSNEDYYPYKYNCKIITNIKPNPNKNGSNDPYWTVNRGNTY